MMARHSGIWILSTLINQKRNVKKVGPPLKKLSGSAHEHLPIYVTFDDTMMSYSLL